MTEMGIKIIFQPPAKAFILCPQRNMCQHRRRKQMHINISETFPHKAIFLYEMHYFFMLGKVRLRDIALNLFSVPPKRASLLPFSIAISDSSPRLTREVFPLMPVSSEAFSSSSSSIYSVVLMGGLSKTACHRYLHQLKPVVNGFVTHRLNDIRHDLPVVLIRPTP